MKKTQTIKTISTITAFGLIGVGMGATSIGLTSCGDEKPDIQLNQGGIAYSITNASEDSEYTLGTCNEKVYIAGGTTADGNEPSADNPIDFFDGWCVSVTNGYMDGEDLRLGSNLIATIEYDGSGLTAGQTYQIDVWFAYTKGNPMNENTKYDYIQKLISINIEA